MLFRLHYATCARCVHLTAHTQGIGRGRGRFTVWHCVHTNTHTHTHTHTHAKQSAHWPPLQPPLSCYNVTGGYLQFDIVTDLRQLLRQGPCPCVHVLLPIRFGRVDQNLVVVDAVEALLRHAALGQQHLCYGVDDEADDATLALVLR